MSAQSRISAGFVALLDGVGSTEGWLEPLAVDVGDASSEGAAELAGVDVDADADGVPVADVEEDGVDEGEVAELADADGSSDAARLPTRPASVTDVEGLGSGSVDAAADEVDADGDWLGDGVEEAGAAVVDTLLDGLLDELADAEGDDIGDAVAEPEDDAVADADGEGFTPTGMQADGRAVAAVTTPPVLDAWATGAAREMTPAMRAADVRTDVTRLNPTMGPDGRSNHREPEVAPTCMPGFPDTYSSRRRWRHPAPTPRNQPAQRSRWPAFPGCHPRHLDAWPPAFAFDVVRCEPYGRVGG